MRRGKCSSSRKSSLVARCSSPGIPSFTGSAPAAIRKWRPSRTSSPTLIVFRPVNRACPSKVSIPLSAYIRSCFPGTGSVKPRLNAINSGQSMSSFPATPRVRMRDAKSTASAPETSIFFGSQPRSAQVPPNGRKSITATLQPAARTRIAAVIAAVPVPTITRSYVFPIPYVRIQMGRGASRLSAAGALRLHRRALDRAERAENAAVAGIGPEQRPAMGALIVELTGVGGHRFRPGVDAPRTSQHGLEDRLVHGFGLEGKPAFAVAFVSEPTLALESSKVTTASFFSMLTLTLETPGTRDSAFLTVIGQASQYIDGTSSATVFVSADDGAARPVSATTDRSLRILIGVPFSVKERCDIREDEDGEQPRRYDPEADPVASPDPRHGANSAGLAGRGPVDAPPGPPERRERYRDEHGLIRLERLQI